MRLRAPSPDSIVLHVPVQNGNILIAARCH